MNTINKAENIYQELLDLEKNSRNVKTAHFHAAKTKKQAHRNIGLGIIIANVLIFSPLINLLISYQFAENTDNLVAITIKILAIIGASLAGIQTLFNWQKESELHLSAGEVYANIYHRSGTLLAKYKDEIINPNKFSELFDSLQQEYLQANSNYKLCVPSEHDFKIAEKSISKRTKNN
jgi:hypothetical protein